MGGVFDPPTQNTMQFYIHLHTVQERPINATLAIIKLGKSKPKPVNTVLSQPIPIGYTTGFIALPVHKQT